MQESGEKYLETIYLLQRALQKVRSVDVANELGYSKPSVSRAIGLLRDQNFVEIVSGEGIVLTKTGKKQAEAIVDKQETITQFLQMTTDVDIATAQKEAEKMRHFISDKTYDGIRNFIKQVEAYHE